MKLQPLPLRIDLHALKTFSSMTEVIPDDFQQKYSYIWDVCKQALTSKQCNEPYEKLLSLCLGVTSVGKKHGWDGVDDLENPMEVYEYKPVSNKISKRGKVILPSGIINDDSIAKIEKCERLEEEGKKGWMILAGIDKEKYTFDCIYKFPLQIYTEHRKQNLAKKIKKNKEKENIQTRIQYTASVCNSIKLCEQLNLEYYVWKRE